MEKRLSDYGICRTINGEYWLSKSEPGKTTMFKQYDDYEDVVIALHTEDLDKLWEEYQQALLLK